MYIKIKHQAVMMIKLYNYGTLYDYIPITTLERSLHLIIVTTLERSLYFILITTLGRSLLFFFRTLDHTLSFILVKN